MNTVTPRVFIAATRQNDGKTTTSLGLLAALKKVYPRVGYIKPVGQRFLEIEQQKIDEDTVLMDHVFRLNCPLGDMSPIAVEPDFTRRYLECADNEALVEKIQKAFDRVAWEKDFVLCEGSGHAGVGSVFDLSNATVARILGAQVVIVTQGGIGRPIDEVCLNQALFEREGVEIIGVIVNKVLPERLEFIRQFVERGLARKGLTLLGVLPYQPVLTKPTMDAIQEGLRATPLNQSRQIHNLVDRVVVGAMGAQDAHEFFRQGVLMITPGDREDLILAAATAAADCGDGCTLAGIIIAGRARLSEATTKVIERLPFPVLRSEADSYDVASQVHDLTVKTRPGETRKISLIQELIAQHVDLDRILQSLKLPCAPAAVRAE